ncbi:glycosyltransferase family 2 protein [Pseudomonas sp. Marseille-QA0892]
MQKIYAVVLTYNRKELLERCLKAVYAQTHKCDGVIVVDNASTDGTEQMLAEAAFPGLKFYVLSKNIGAAGGFNAGFRLAYQAGADYVWMMDDDVIPDPDALEQLMNAETMLKRKEVDHSFVLSTAFTEEGEVTNAPACDARLNKVGYERWPALVEHGLVPVARATFVSILVPRASLTEYGVPMAGMFIWGEDSEYTMRISRKSPGFLVGASKVQHLRQKSGTLSILTEENPARIRYHRYHVRNQIYVLRKYGRKAKVCTFIWGKLKLFGRLALRGQFGKASVVMHGLVSSIGFNPAIDAADAPIETLGITVRSPFQPVIPEKPANDEQPQVVGMLQGA